MPPWTLDARRSLVLALCSGAAGLGLALVPARFPLAPLALGAAAGLASGSLRGRVVRSDLETFRAARTVARARRALLADQRGRRSLLLQYAGAGMVLASALLGAGSPGARVAGAVAGALALVAVRSLAERPALRALVVPVDPAPVPYPDAGRTPEGSGTFVIRFDELAAVRGHRRLPLRELKREDHLHGRLTVAVQGRPLPRLGHSGDGDACFASWVAELEAIRVALCEPAAPHVYDEGELGQPAYVFEAEGQRGFVTVADSGFSGEGADPAWQRVEFSVADFVAEHDAFRRRFRAFLRATAPGADAWLESHGLRRSRPAVGHGLRARTGR